VSDLVDRVREDGLLQAGRPVVVLFSGGQDSTCLLDVAVRVVGPEAVTALHVNYGLRDSADDDQRHCGEVCQGLGIELVARPAPPRPLTGNLQAWARQVRYAAAAQLSGDFAVGHTASDQVETILYRLASSPSRRALRGMAPRDGRVVRPLLGFTREQTAAHCRQHGLPWREDPSNALPLYARNRIRHELLPALRRVHPAAEANLLSLAEILRAEGEVLDAEVEEVLGGGEEIPVSRLTALPAPLRRLVVQQLADAVRGTPAAGVARRAEEVCALAEGASLDLPGGVRATVRGGRLRLLATPPMQRRSGPRPQPREDRGRSPHLYSSRVHQDPAIGEILVPAEDLSRRVRELGEQVSRDYEGKNLLLIGVLKGAVFFLSDLMRHIEIPVEVDFMAVASYGSATRSSGVVRILKDLDAAIEGRDVLIVEDIVDSGLTLQYLLRNLQGRDPASLEVCALLVKPDRRKVDLPTRYVGFEIPDRFAIGYGLDHAERYRNLPYVAALNV
jgi:hypoxanthine phosphoribosyltransferase